MGNKGWDNHIEAMAWLWDNEDITCPPHPHQTGFLPPAPAVPRARVGSEVPKSHKMEANQESNQPNQPESQCLSGCTEDFYSSNGPSDPVGGVEGGVGPFCRTGLD